MAKSSKIKTSKKKAKSKPFLLNMDKPAMEKTAIEDMLEETLTQEKEAVVDSPKQVTETKTPCIPCKLKYVNERISVRKILIATEVAVIAGTLTAYYILKRRGATSGIIWFLLVAGAMTILLVTDILKLKDFTEKQKAIQQALLLEQVTKLNN